MTAADRNAPPADEELREAVERLTLLLKDGSTGGILPPMLFEADAAAISTVLRAVQAPGGTDARFETALEEFFLAAFDSGLQEGLARAPSSEAATDLNRAARTAVIAEHNRAIAAASDLLQCAQENLPFLDRQLEQFSPPYHPAVQKMADRADRLRAAIAAAIRARANTARQSESQRE